jgi:hypothetical protein
MQRVTGIFILMWIGTLGWSAALSAQQPGVHYYHQGNLPPGAIGNMRLQRGGPVPGYFQPVEIQAPAGTSVSLAVEGQFEEPRPAPRKVGLLIGAVYRLRVTGIHLAEGQEVFPTIELIDRLYPPIGQERKFSIPVDISEEDLRLALEGKFVTRVIYLEDPRNALPAGMKGQTQNWFDSKPGEDPLAVADTLGRPVAILRLGGRLPDAPHGFDSGFFFGFPPFMRFPAEPSPTPAHSVNNKENNSVKVKLLPTPDSMPTSEPVESATVKILPPPPAARMSEAHSNEGR